MNLDFIKSRLLYKKFQNKEIKIIVINSGYFLIKEVAANLIKLGHKIKLIKLYDKLPISPSIAPDDNFARAGFLSDLLKNLTLFKPDFIFTVNMLSFDGDGTLADILYELQIPVVNWFIDTPLGILGKKKCFDKDNFISISWEKDFLKPFNQFYINHTIIYSPYGTSLNKPIAPVNNNNYLYNLSFVGSSMISASKKWKHISKISQDNSNHFTKEIENNLFNINSILEKYVSINKENFDLENFYFFEASRVFREKIIKLISQKYDLTIFGDQNWKDYNLKANLNSFINYYKSSEIYNNSKININLTSPQMKSAVNQRIFDVFASGGFLLTDYRKDLDDLFKDNDFPYFKSTDELVDKLDFIYNHPKFANKTILKLQNTIFKEHTYEQRLKKLLPQIKEKFKNY